MKTTIALILFAASVAALAAENTNTPAEAVPATNAVVMIEGVIVSLNGNGWVVAGQIGSQANMIREKQGQTLRGKTSTLPKPAGQTNLIQLINPPRTEFNRYLALSSQRSTILRELDALRLQAARAQATSADQYSWGIDYADSAKIAAIAKNEAAEMQFARRREIHQRQAQFAATQAKVLRASITSLENALTQYDKKRCGYDLTKPFPVKCYAVETGKAEPGSKLRVFDARSR